MMTPKQAKKAHKAAKKAAKIGSKIAKKSAGIIATSTGQKKMASMLGIGGKKRKMGVRGEAKVEVKSLKKEAVGLKKSGEKKAAKELRTKAKNVAIKWRNEKRAARGSKKAQAKLDSGYKRGHKRGYSRDKE